MPSTRTVLLWEVAVCAAAAAVLAVWMAVDAWRDGCRVGWPVPNRWLVVCLFAALALRFGDLAVARFAGRDPNPPHTIVDWALVCLFMVWVGRRRIGR